MKTGDWKGVVGLGAQTLGMSTDFEQEEDRDFPGGLMVKSACQCRARGFGVWSGKISHAAGPLSP